MRTLALAVVLAAAVGASAQTSGLLDTRKAHFEALQTFDLHTFAIGHGRLKSYWRTDVFTGLDTSQNAVTLHQTVYGGALFCQWKLGAHMDVPNPFNAGHDLIKWHWDSGWKLLIGPGGQFENKARPHTGLYVGLQF